MTEYDLNGNWQDPDQDELELMLEDRRLPMEDADHKRSCAVTHDPSVRTVIGLLIYPFGMVAADIWLLWHLDGQAFSSKTPLRIS